MSTTGKSKTDDITRLAIVFPDRCRPKKCGHECRHSCPVNKLGKKCIVVSKESPCAMISERHCIGCNICVTKCPFDAIRIINLPSALDSQVSYRYGLNSFKLHRLPVPRVGQVLGLVGENGIGKSTALNILAGELRPNFGDIKDPVPEWDAVFKHYKGSELLTYFKRLSERELKVAHKVQYVDAIVKTDKAAKTVEAILRKARKLNPERYEGVVRTMQLGNLLGRQLNQLSGGELQRFALAFVALRPEINIYLIDEPSSYLDIKQRLTAGRLIRGFVADSTDSYVVCVEHDLAVLDYLSDYTSVLYGQAGIFGVISLPFSVREGINVFLNGFIPTENMKFRAEALRFNLVDSTEDDDAAKKEADAKKAARGDEEDAGGAKEGKQRKTRSQEYPYLEIRFAPAAQTAPGADPDPDIEGPAAAAPAASAEGAPAADGADGATSPASPASFELTVQPGTFDYSRITLLLGENGMGKTCFIKALAGALRPAVVRGSLPKLPFSIKPQTINPSFPGTVEELFQGKIPETFNHSGFQDDVVRPLDIKHLMERQVRNLSGGELQRVALVLALGKPAEMYLVDEPSAYLDAAQRLVAAKVIKRFILNAKKACFVVEHDFLMALYLADSVVVFTGTPGERAVANPPCGLLQGLNQFLKIIQVTFRRDAETLRPRVNKLNSSKDREQKLTGQYFTNFTDDN